MFSSIVDCRDTTLIHVEIAQSDRKRYIKDKMISTIQISQMSRKEKLQTMEDIWVDLSKVEAEVESPLWHEEVLKETEAQVAAGQERMADWNIAKLELRKRFE